jgi:predicted amidohydrolase
VRNAPAVEERLETAERMLAEAAAQEVAIVCFPEAYIPGLRGFDFPVPPLDQDRQERALGQVRAAAKRNGVAVVMGMEWQTEIGAHNAAMVIGRDGEVCGWQVKNQIPPEEEPHYVPDGQRRLFEIEGVPFGIAICHEGWRYPETVRWAAARDAKIVFHPQLTGSDLIGPTLTRWGDPAAPYYEKAMIARAVENVIYFASVNYAFRCQESATSLIAPDGTCLAHVPYGQEQLLVCDLDLTQATGFYAKRYDPALYPD